MDKKFWIGKKVLLTGHTGFKGAWMAIWLSKMGADVTGISLTPSTNPNLFECANISSLINSNICNICNLVALVDVVNSSRPDVIFHFAAQSLVREGYIDPISTFATNILGTANILESVRSSSSVKVVVAITTDKVYRNLEHVYPYRETDELGGYDPYSASKAAAEMVISCYRDSFLNAKGVALASTRAGNVIGGGDWAKNRLIPDAVRAWESGEILEIRRPFAVRPWQHVLEPLAAYIKLAEKLWVSNSFAGAYNFGPLPHEAATVKDVVLLAKKIYGVGEVAWGDGSEGPHEAGWLALDTSKARSTLDLSPRWNLEEAVRRTMNWYSSLHDHTNALDLCIKDITDYEKIL